jgi:branched-chain amino acid aminotransferase
MRAWVNGRLLSAADEPVLSVLDHGLTVGDGAFETIKVTSGQPFALSRHLRRLARSLHGLGLTPPAESTLRDGIDAVIGAQEDLRLRITVTGGPSPLGSERGSEGATVAIVSAPLNRPEPTTAAVTVPWPRNERGALSGLKTTSYAENVVALARAKEAGASEAIFANTVGDLCEGTGSNVFYVLGGEVVTPTLRSGCLAGITRELIVEWFDVVERDAPLNVLHEADEVFVASTIREVQGIARCDERELIAPGPVTAGMAERWLTMCDEQLDP